MRIRNSLKAAKVRDKNCRVVRRRGRVYVINKKNPRMKAARADHHGVLPRRQQGQHRMIPPSQEIVICFAHAAYQMKACFDALNTGIANFELREPDALEQRSREADVIVVSGMWHNGLIPLAASCALSSRSARAPISSTRRRWRHAASGWRARPASMRARWRSTRCR